MPDEFSIDIHPLKRFAMEKLSHDSILRNILLGEDDPVPTTMLLGRTKTRLQL